MEYKETLQEIRRKCRMAMNGEASAGMRKYGLVYKLNFGLMIAQIKNIARDYDKCTGLADLLWVQDTRELKILASLLHPADDMDAQKATLWAKQIPNQEIREQITLNLFQNMPEAEKVAVEWTKDEEDSLRATGYWLIGRLLLAQKMDRFQNLDALNRVWIDAVSEDLLLRNSALLALKQIGRRDGLLAQSILERMANVTAPDSRIKNEVMECLAFEFEYFS